jgi:two-component system sensor histidine kinase PilS (NtrC family)
MPAWAENPASGHTPGRAWPLLESLVPGTGLSRERLRAFRLLGGARIAMGVALLGWFALTGIAHAQPLHGPGLWVALAYLALSLVQFLLSLNAERSFPWRVLAAVLTDLLAFGTLQFIAGDMAREFVLAYTLPVLAAGVYGSLRFNLATAAAVTLLLLAQALVTLGTRAPDPQMLSAAFVGAAYFAMGLLTWQLSQRLVRQEERARHSEIRANRQRAINRHVLLEQPIGVLVLDAALRVESANPAAGRMLGLHDWETGGPEGAGTMSYSGADVLARAVRAQESSGAPPVPLVFDGAEGMRVQARVQTLRQLPGGPGYVVFVQDLREISQQIQQDKLAALGRLVAAVAHEIRNPLGAIAQANQLSGEAGLSDAQRERMSTLIAQNVERLNRIVEDVLDLGRSVTRSGIELQPMRLLRELASEFGDDMPGRVLLLADDEKATLNFDPQHLRRVLVNLLGNARRFASHRPGAIRIRMRGVGQVTEIGVANDGEPVAPALRHQLFEPFFTTDSRGTGLGLYISQELCTRYETQLEYRVRRGATPVGEFVIRTRAPHPVMPRPTP